MVWSRRLGISSRDKGEVSDFLAFSNYNHTLDKGAITKRILLCICPRISSIAKELFLFSSFNRFLKNSSIFLTCFKLFGTGCTSQIASWILFSRMHFSNCVCIRCRLRREVPFKLIFVRYNMGSLGFLVFFLTLRARGMRRRWRRRQTRRSPPSLLFTWLLTSLLSSSRWRTRMGRRGCATSFPCLSFLERFAPFWTRILLDNSLLYFWTMRAILLIILIASFALYITEINLCHSLPPLCKDVKSWKRKMRVWAPLLYCHDVVKIQHSNWKTDFMK